MELGSVRFYTDSPELAPKRSSPPSHFDLFSSEDKTVGPGEAELVNTGVEFDCPEHIYGEVISRPGLELAGLSVASGVVVDSSYKGPVFVLVRNHNLGCPFRICMGQQVATLAFRRLWVPTLIRLEEGRGE